MVQDVSLNEDENGSNEGITVESGWFDVEITLPADFVGEENPDEIFEDEQAEGLKEIKVNADGSVTYKMTKALHNEMMEEMAADLTKQIEDIKHDENYVSIEDIQFNRTFSEFEVIVDREAFENSFDGFITISLGIMGMYYQIFDGVNPEQVKVDIVLVDVESGDNFETFEFPDDMDE